MSNDNQQKLLNPREIVDPREGAFTEAGYRGYLPHLYKNGCSYFVTFCLTDVAAERRTAHRHRLEREGPAKIFSACEPDASAGWCVLKDPEIAKLVEKALLHFQGDRYALSAWCVMPNHVHVVVTPFVHHPLGRILHSWK